MKDSEQVRLEYMEHWFHHGNGRCLFEVQVQWVDEYLLSNQPYLCAQIGGPPYQWVKHSKKTHAIHLDRRKQYFCLQGHSVCSDFYALPFADESFDAVFCPHVHEILDKPKQFFNEVVRITKVGSPIVVMGINPKSLWGLQNLMVRENYFPWIANHWGQHKIVSELEGLPIRVEREECQFYGFYPGTAFVGGVRFKNLEKLMSSHLSQSGAIYFIEFIKTAYPLDFEMSNAV